MNRNFNLAHIRMPVPRPTEYKTPPQNVPKKLPPRDRTQHAKRLKQQLREIDKTVETISLERKKKGLEEVDGVLVTVKGAPKYDADFGPLQSKRKGIEIINKGTSEKGEDYAVLRIPKGDTSPVLDKIEQYENEKEDTRKGEPKHNKVLAVLEEIGGAALEEMWVGPKEMLPNNNEITWWEIWLLGGHDEPFKAETMRNQFHKFAIAESIQFDKEERIDFPDRQVFIVEANRNTIAKAIGLLDCIAEIRPPSKGIRDWKALNSDIETNVQMDNGYDSKFLPPDPGSPSIALIDTGVADEHPLLKPAILKNGLHSIDPRTSATGDYKGHGTEMAGVALFDDISKVLLSNVQYKYPAYLESVRIKIDTQGTHKQLWGKTTEEAVKKIETQVRNNRIYCMAIGGPSVSNGKPSSWSATIDNLCFNHGDPRLIVIAAGNVDPIDQAGYPTRNLATQLDDPAQARNAITVGAMCNFDQIANPPVQNIQAIAKAGELSPHSSTHLLKNDAIKPDIVCEGSNVGWDGSLADFGLEGLAILTTNKDFIFRKPLTLTCGTSPAAAEASRILAQIWKENPGLKPETVRALLVHSASWTEEMKKQFPNKRDLLRSCGYGVPNVSLACKSAKSSVTLIAEGRIRPFYTAYKMGKKNRMVKDGIKKDIIIFDLPWPEEVLLNLGEEIIELRVTLSYFADPNPKNTLRNYEGAGLQWELQSADETEVNFIKRINFKEREKGEKGFSGSKEWEIGPTARARGTLQSDRWTGTAVELAARKKLAVFPTKGWWDENNPLYKDKEIPFSLVVSIHTKEEDIDLYNLISNKVSVSIDA